MRAPKQTKESSHLLDPLGNIALNPGHLPQQHNGLVGRRAPIHSYPKLPWFASAKV